MLGAIYILEEQLENIQKILYFFEFRLMMRLKVFSKKITLMNLNLHIHL